MRSDLVNVARAALLGGSELWALARRGQLSPSALWVVAQGAQRYLAAIAAGDVAPRAEIARRAAICRSCPSRTDGVGNGVRIGYCGPAFLEIAGPPRTCGCLCDGKIRVASEACPQGRFVSLN